MSIIYAAEELKFPEEVYNAPTIGAHRKLYINFGTQIASEDEQSVLSRYRTQSVHFYFQILHSGLESALEDRPSGERSLFRFFGCELSERVVSN